MPKINAGKRGIAIYLVLGALIMAVVLAKVILNLILNQASITHHRLSRVQAYYASLAGMNYALEKLRTGQWVVGNDCTNAAPCNVNFERYYDFPASISYFNNSSQKQFQITICNHGDTYEGSECNTTNLPAGTNTCVYSTVKYTAP